MKTKTFLIALLISNFCVAQNTVPKNELGLNLYGNEFVRGNISNRAEMKHYVFSGFQYKRNFNNKYLLRFSYGYSAESYNNSVESGINSGGWFFSSGTNQIQDYKLGFEKVFSQKKIKPFVFMDLGYRYFNEKGIDSYVNTSSSNVYNSYNSTNYYLSSSIGFGVKYYPTNHIYLSLETSIGVKRELFMGNDARVSNIYNPVNSFVFGVRF